MSTIPPNWMASVLGTHDTQKSASAAKTKEAAEQGERTSNTGFAERLHNVIDNAERDGEVYADAEGLGSQGRAPAEESQKQESEEDHESGRSESGLDVQA